MASPKEKPPTLRLAALPLSKKLGATNGEFPVSIVKWLVGWCTLHDAVFIGICQPQTLPIPEKGQSARKACSTPIQVGRTECIELAIVALHMVENVHNPKLSLNPYQVYNFA
jgi:hypothetical protein